MTSSLSLGPRVVIAGTHSGVGKTTIATGLMAAMRARGVRVGAAKVGPDYIDPGYHALATGRPSRNLDAWMCGPDRVPAIAARAAAGADVLVIEGVMGLFDGAADGSPSSTADVARLLEAPVVVVVNCASMSGTAAAIVHGIATFDQSVDVVGVILNQVAGDGHEALLRAALADAAVPVVGVVHRDDALVWRDRHLGLIPVAERPAEVAGSLDRLAAVVSSRCDVDEIRRIAVRAPRRTVRAPMISAPTDRARIAHAVGPAFSFHYPDNAEILSAHGAELVPFDPAADASLPEQVTGLIIGGGFPEMYAPALAANDALLADTRHRIARGLRVWAECGGLLWLCRSLDGQALVGAIEAEARMTTRLTLGYRAARTTVDTPLGPPGTTFRGHEFHYSAITPDGTALALTGRQGASGDGFATPATLATYVHVHLAGQEHLAEAFVRSCAASGTSW